jgi:hypothetical protein
MAAAPVRAPQTENPSTAPLTAEESLYSALRRLPTAYQIFVNPRAGIDEAVDPYDRPINFIIMHPAKGLVVITMKEGEIVEEVNGFLSQYQPHRQVYKIMDPLKQAKTAYDALTTAAGEDMTRYLPNAIIAVFPDTLRSEFADPKEIYFFREDYEAANFTQRLIEMIPDAPPGVDEGRIRIGLEQLGAFLKSHSDHHHQLRERTQRAVPQKAAQPAPFKVPAAQPAAPAKKPPASMPNVRKKVQATEQKKIMRAATRGEAVRVLPKAEPPQKPSAAAQAARPVAPQGRTIVQPPQTVTPPVAKAPVKPPVKSMAARLATAEPRESRLDISVGPHKHKSAPLVVRPEPSAPPVVVPVAAKAVVKAAPVRPPVAATPTGRRPVLKTQPDMRPASKPAVTIPPSMRKESRIGKAVTYIVVTVLVVMLVYFVVR